MLFDPWLTALVGHPAGTCPGVGGTIELFVDGSVSLSSADEGSDPSTPLYAVLAGAAAATVAVIATGGWYARRRFLR